MTSQTVSIEDPGTPQPMGASRNGKHEETPGTARRVRITVNLPADLVEQMRDAVYWTPGVTLAWLVARAMKTSLTELQSKRQGPFPRRSKPLRAGRPRLTGQSMTVQTWPDGTLARSMDRHPRPPVAP